MVSTRCWQDFLRPHLGQNSLCEPRPQTPTASSSSYCLRPAQFVRRGLKGDSACTPFPDGQEYVRVLQRGEGKQRQVGPLCSTIFTNGQSSPWPHADETRRGHRPDKAGRKGTAISTNEAGGLKAFYFEAVRPPREQSVLPPWLPGTPGGKGFGRRSRGGGLGKAWRDKVGGRTRDGGRRAKWTSPLLFPSKKTPGSRSVLHSGHWPITLFNALDQSSWKQRKQHATQGLTEHLRDHKLN